MDKHIPNALIRKHWLDLTISTEEGARRCGLTRVNFWRRAKALGLEPRKMGPAPMKLPDDFNEMWLARVSRREIAKLIGTADYNITGLARRRKLPPRLKGYKSITLQEYYEQKLKSQMEKDANDSRIEVKLYLGTDAGHAPRADREAMDARAARGAGL